MIHRKIGMSTCCEQFNDPTLFDRYAQAGIEAAEISLSTARYATYPYRAFARKAKDAGVELWSFHLPFVPFAVYNPASLDAGVRKNTLRAFGEYFKLCNALGIRRAVIHPSGEPIPEEERAEAKKWAKDTLAKLAPMAKEEGVILCVEDLPRTCLGNSSQEILDLISVDDSLRVCFDTNHLLGESIKDFVKAVGHKIETLHVSDYDGKDERHWLPGEGCIDWPELMDLLDECGYEGAFLYELGFRPNRKTIDRPRLLTCEDFARNARELEARAPITVIGKSRLS